ncbi:hypothetical protein HZB78_00080 [Candidatus Collierbacteria bacterium]|nr:hypothetical protein [Candidatus Collierbacteria bacterium]
MTDQLNPSLAGMPVPPSSTTLPDAPPPQDIAVDPIPLPSSAPIAADQPATPVNSILSQTDVKLEPIQPETMAEVVIEQQIPQEETVSAKTVQKGQDPDVKTPGPAETKNEVNTVPEEDPSIIRPPQPPTGQQDGISLQQHKKISTKVLAGITSLVFLISGLSVGIYFNSQNFGVLDPRRYAADNMCNVNRVCTEDWQWREGWADARKEENKESVPVRNEYTNANDDQNNNQDGIQAEIIRHAGESGVGDPGAGKRTGEFVTTSGGTPGGVTPILTGANTQTGDAGNCYGIGGGQAERDCLANAKNGQYTSGVCRGKTVEECSKLGKPVYCSGSQEKAGTGRAGEFLSCGGSSTSGCGQVDVYDGTTLIGFVIDKSGCNGKPPETSTNNASPRDIQIPTVPSGITPTVASVSANCQSLVGQTKDNAGTWIDRSDAEFVGLARAGGQVRFVCTGHKTQGNFTKAAFFINSILHVDDVIKLSADKYAVPFTIPASGELKVEAVLLHDAKGWVD